MARTFIVRLKSNDIRKRSIVGMYAVPETGGKYNGINTLFTLVDEIVDPILCEYIEIKKGGIEFHENVRMIWDYADIPPEGYYPIEHEGDVEMEEPLPEWENEDFNGGRLTEHLYGDMPDKKWKSF